MCWIYLNSLSGIYNNPTLFILQCFFDKTKDFSLEIWYNKNRKGWSDMKKTEKYIYLVLGLILLVVIICGIVYGIVA